MADNPARAAFRAFKQRVATPRGLLMLFGSTVGVAVVLAVVFASYRDAFEGLVREKYPALSAEAQVLIKRLETEKPKAALVGVPFKILRQLYGAWMIDAEPRYAPLAERLHTGRAADTRILIERSLLAGAPHQRVRAIAFALATRSSSVATSLRVGLQRAREVGDDALAVRLEAALKEIERR